MKQKKAYYQQLNINGFTWSGYWKGYHHFYNNGQHVRCTDNDIEDGNLIDMINMGLTK